MLFAARSSSPRSVRVAASALALLLATLGSLAAPLTAHADQQGGWELMLTGRFDVRYGDLLEHERVLDLRAGTLNRRARWRSPAGKQVVVTSTRLVSLTQRSVAAIEYTVEAVVEFALDGTVLSEMLRLNTASTGPFAPRPAAVAWAKQLLTDTPHALAVVATHAFTYHDDTLYDRTRHDQEWCPSAYGVGKAGGLDGEQLFAELRSAGNVQIIVSGHVLGRGVARVSRTNHLGRPCHALLHEERLRCHLQGLERIPDQSALSDRMQ